MSTNAADDARLAAVLRALVDAPGIDLYPDLFPRLGEKHLHYLGDEDRAPRAEAAALLTEAGRGGPAGRDEAAEAYRKQGELPALRAVADPVAVAQAAMEWQREIAKSLNKADEWAVLWDREGVRCPDDLTWARRVKRLREEVGAEHAGSPASQEELIRACMAEMERALNREKQGLQRRLQEMRAELESKRETLDEEVIGRAEKLTEDASKNIDSNDLILALRKLGQLEEMLSGRPVRPADERRARLPLPYRVNPLGRTGFHFDAVLAAVRGGEVELKRRGLAEYFPSDEALKEALSTSGFLVQQVARRMNWGPYFASLREWLGLDENRPRRGRRLHRLDVPNLEPKGQSLPGRWTFLTADPWQGAPFYEDVCGSPRVVAVVRLAVADADRGRVQVIVQLASQALRDLLIGLPAETDDECRFRHDGLTIVLLPGETLTSRPYDQFRQQVQLDKAAGRAGRIAYLDDLDLLRLLPVPADDRFRALLELALPRFPESLAQTYQDSDAVRPRMFFGRSDELTQLSSDKGATVVFSGRKMGKSSLLSRFQAQCSKETDRRAILVGCSGIANGRSWMVLNMIEDEFSRLLRREGQQPPVPQRPRPGALDEPARAMLAAKERFSEFLDAALPVLGSVGVRTLYVLLDEADNFVRAEMEETSGGKDSRAAVSWFLRDLQTSTYPGRLRFIFAGYDQIGRIFRDPGLGHSAFGNWGGLLKLGPLDTDAAGDLVVKPLSALGMVVSEDMAERILDFTSGHASLIQAFCRKLADGVRAAEANWPLQDVAVEFGHVQAVADDQRGAGDPNYRHRLEQTLGLNLDVARAYPLKLLFLALVSANGLGAGGVLGLKAFTFEDALQQVRSAEGGLIADLTPELVLDSLDLLAQLGLLEDRSDVNGRAFTFKARHYVNVLRTRDGFRANLEQALKEWRQAGRHAAQAEPRYVWTLPDSDLRTLRQRTPRAAVVVGLPGSGRTYLADMLASPSGDSTPQVRLDAGEPHLAAKLDGLLLAPPASLVVVGDPAGVVKWPLVSSWLCRAGQVGLALRWVGGPSLAWDLATDLGIALTIDGPYSLGPLGPAELEPWAARELGGDSPPSAVSIPEVDRAALLQLTGGLLPVLEMFRNWLLKVERGFPDQLRRAHAESFLRHLESTPAAATNLAARLAQELPAGLLAGLHQLYVGAAQWELEEFARGDLATVSSQLGALKDDDLTRLFDAARWLGLLPDAPAGTIRVPYRSVLGLLVRQARFAEP